MLFSRRSHRLALATLVGATGCGTVEDAPIVSGSGGAMAAAGGATAGGTTAGGASSGGAAEAGGFPSTGGGFGTGGATGGSLSTGGDAAGGSGGAGGISGDGGAASGGAEPGTGGASPTGVCGGDTPHGCYVPRPGNPSGCPPQIHEQSSFYPPPDEWEACSSPPFVPCVYEKPGGGEAECRCNLGTHWLCSY